MFPTFYTPASAVSESQFGFEFYAMSFVNTAGNNIFYGVKANKTFTGYPDTSPLTGATITEVTLSSFNVPTPLNLAWDGENTFIVGGYGNLSQLSWSKSVDKGLTWSNLSFSPANATGDVFLLDYHPAQDVYIAVVGNSVAPFYGIYKSTDAGANWTDITSAVTSTGFSGGYLNWWSWVDGNTFYLGSNSSTVIAASTDGGVTWSAASVPSGTWRLFRLNNLYVISDPNAPSIKFSSTLSSNLGDWTDRSGNLSTLTIDSLTYVSTANEPGYGLWVGCSTGNSEFIEMTNTDFVTGASWTRTARARSTTYIGGVAGTASQVKNMAIYLDNEATRLTFSAYQVGDNGLGNKEAYTYINTLAQATTVDSPIGVFIDNVDGTFKGK